jgi:hypothetical protein
MHRTGFELGGIDPVVARHRVGQHHDLARVRRVGEDLAPAGGSGREDQVALGRDAGTAQSSAEDETALQGEQAAGP